MEHVDVDGLRLAYRRSGHGPPVVLLHGAVGDSRVWRDQLEGWSDDFTLVAWDAPGCGGSSDPPESFRLPDYARCLAGLLDAIGFDRSPLLGHSWGSGLALELYRQRPGLVRSLVLVGAYAGWAGSLSPDEVDRRRQFALRVADLPAGSFDPRSMPGLFSDVLPKERADELAAIMSEIRPAGTRVMTHAFAEADLRPMLRDVDVPTLLLYGEDDQRSSVSVGEALHHAIPGSTFVVVPATGHMLSLESPERFGSEVRRFLSSMDE